MLKIDRDHRARLVSSNWESFAYTNSNTILLLYAGDIRVPPRVPASGPEPCGGNNSNNNNNNNNNNKTTVTCTQVKQTCFFLTINLNFWIIINDRSVGSIQIFSMIEDKISADSYHYH